MLYQHFLYLTVAVILSLSAMIAEEYLLDGITISVVFFIPSSKSCQKKKY